MSELSSDPVIRELRAEISALDRTLVETVNARIALVARLRRYKAEKGLPFVDPERERELLEELAAANEGPLSDEGLRELVAGLLDLTKREVARGDGRGS
ncbi:MAG: chorismate mutase [Thermoleophilia bacterium]|nr:chorismate mutase [Gaiellaceae bacterium]MDW8338087.1 chorismate mutase [Thermoleophilia bacterium]